MTLSDWEVRIGFRHKTGWENVRKSVSRWHSFQPLFVRPPDHSEFISPLEHDTTSEIAARSARRSQWLIIGVASLTAFGFLLKGMLTADIKAINIVMASLPLISLLVFDYYFSIRNLRNLTHRAIAINFFSSKALTPISLTIAFMVLIYAMQFAISYGKKPDEIFFLYGALYNSIAEGEFWRLLVGPYLHSGIPHWGTNLVLSTFAFTIALRLSVFGAISSFFLCNCIGALTGYIAAIMLGTSGDVYVGVSSGIYGLFGFSSLYIWKTNTVEIARSFGITVLVYSVTFILMTWILYPQAANLSHAIGFLAGSIFGLIAASLRHRFSTTDH